jgi:DNA repair exonuclease SbcCD ATPase subunit
MADYTNKKAAYEKDKAAYDNANFIKRQLMKNPLIPVCRPCASPTRFSNRLVADIDAQIKAKEAELLAVNNKRRDRVAQVEADARQLREEFDSRSSTKREEADRKREELLAAQAALATQWTAEQKQIDQEFLAAAQKVDGIRAELDACAKKAEGFYEAREAAIKTPKCIASPPRWKSCAAC